MEGVMHMLNVAEKLKDTEIGKSLYSPLFGPLKYNGMEQNNENVIIDTIARGNKHMWFNQYGQYFPAAYTDSECMLFPDDRKTWADWPNPKPEPKYKVGEWIVRGEGFVYEPSLITEIRDYYICELLNGERVTYTLNDVHKNFHLWTIEDARDGDVLVCYSEAKGVPIEQAGIFKQYVGRHGGCSNTFWAHAGIDWDGNILINGYMGSTTILPATQEQHNFLFAKMKEAGYTWDEKKKEPKNILPHYDISNFHAGMPVLVRDYDNSRWSYVQFSHYVGEECGFKFNACGIPYIQCIPFNEETKHLLGTTNPCDERFINW